MTIPCSIVQPEFGMSHDLEVALETARRWRDLGNAILLVGILAEILIEALWPDRPSVFTLKWRGHLCGPRNIAILMAGLVTVGGLWLELFNPSPSMWPLKDSPLRRYRRDLHWYNIM